MNSILPSVLLTPSIAFKSPEKLTVLPSAFLALTLSTNTASISSNKTMEPLGVLSNSLLKESSSSLFPDRLTVHKFSYSFEARAKIVDVFPVPGGPYKRYPLL